MPIELIIPIVIALLVIITIYQGLCIVQQSQTVIVERLGKYYRTLSSGVNIIIPFIDTLGCMVSVRLSVRYECAKTDL